MPLLLRQSGPAQGQRFFFERNVLLGRGPLADLEVVDPAVSRRHAQITLAEGRCFLSDLESGNGTYLNGRRISSPEALADGDEVRLGATVFRFRLHGDRGVDESASSEVSLAGPETGAASRSIVRPLAGFRTGGGSRRTEEVARLERRLAFFHEAGRTLARGLDEPTLLAELLDKAMAILPQADRAFVALYDAATGDFRPTAARTREGGTAAIQASRTLLEEVARKREALVSLDASTDAEFQAAKSVRLLSLRAVACVPLEIESRLLGVLEVDSLRQGAGFGADDLDLLVGIAGPIALALEHARAHRQRLDREVMEHDLALARRIQRSFLPARLPDVTGWCTAVEYSPALAVGGDLYDFAPLPDGRYAFAIGDVSGKGVAGALLMARLTSALRAAAARSPSPTAVLEELNELVRGEQTEGMFVTLAFGVLDPQSGRIEMANAGHLPPILRHADGRTLEVQLAPGAPLGVCRPLGAESFGWTLAPGDLLVLVTDGLTEAASPAGERFDTPRVLEVVRQAGPEPKAALEALLKAARAFVAERGFDDDLTVLCLGRR